MYLGYFFFACVVSLVLTPLVYIVMYRLRIVDEPRSAKRKIHKRKIPLGGGLAIFGSLFLVLFLAWQSGDIGNALPTKHLVALAVGGFLLMIGGLLDDKYTLRPIQQIWFPVIATLIIIGFGIGPHAITNPLTGSVIDLSVLRFSVGDLGTIVFAADIMVFVWLMGMMFTTKFLDGLDGLVTGVVTIGALVLFAFTRQAAWFQPEVSLLAIIFAGACVGFLVWNWHPAKIFLGEGGSLFLGFTLGVLAIISGAKIAITFLVMAVPALDVARVIVRRYQRGVPVVKGDNEHLHFKLMANGLKHRQAVLLMYGISITIGLSALFLQSTQKLIALSSIFIGMVLLGFWFAKKDKQISHS